MKSVIQYILTIFADCLRLFRLSNLSPVAMLASLLHVSHPRPHSRSHSTHTHPHSCSQQTQQKDAIDVQITPIPSSHPPDLAPPIVTTIMEAFLDEVRTLFEASLHQEKLHSMSARLQLEYRQKLKASNICMLPSFHHSLPTGQEIGTILALDVGGSTFRIALIELSGRAKDGTDDGMEIKRLKSFPIDNSVRALRGTLFFDWMAARIGDVLAADNHESENKTPGPLPMSLAWSFPIEQTSTRTGSLLAMGKGFLATAGCEGEDIQELVTTACKKQKLNVELQGIVNDASATLLSQAYRDPSTRISLIMGTGINSAVYLPISALQREKFGRREQSWWEEADHVLVNTELSMFGQSVWDCTRWDHELNQAHPLPDFQPLEYKAGGRFLGELVRLVLVEAVSEGVLFQGVMPKGLDIAYGLDTSLIGIFECDPSPNLAAAALALTAAHPLPHSTIPTSSDLYFVRTVSELITSRAAAYVATAVHALWSLQRDEAMHCSACSNKDHVDNGNKGVPGMNKATIACNGSIMEKYPGFKTRCQGWLDELVKLSLREKKQNGGAREDDAIVGIEMAYESSVFGAAVAAVAEG